MNILHKNSLVAVRFILVGILNTIVGYSFYFVFLKFNINYIIALLISHVIGVVHSFIWNKFWTFKIKEDTKRQILKFVSVYAITFILNFIILLVFVEKLNIDKRIAQIFALFIVTLVSFLGHKFWSFKSTTDK